MSIPQTQIKCMISDIEHNRLSPEILAKINKKTTFGPLDENTRRTTSAIKTPNIHAFKMAAPTEDRFPQTI